MREQIDALSLSESGKMKRYKFKLSDEGRGSRRVRMLSPGLNFPTLGVVVFVVIHVAVMLTGGVANGAGLPRELYYDLGLSWAGVSGGKWWQFVTHAFLHGSWSHLVMNCVLFYYGAARLGHILGGGMSWRVFALGVLAGGVAQVGSQALLSGLDPRMPLVGASGGLMAMLLALTTIAPQSRMLLAKVSARNMGLGFLLSSGIFFLISPELGLPVFSKLGRLLVHLGYGFVFQWGHLYHLVGGVVGVIWASKLWGKPVTLEQLQKERAEREDGGTSNIEF